MVSSTERRVLRPQVHFHVLEEVMILERLRTGKRTVCDPTVPPARQDNAPAPAEALP